ncbi:MAG: DUF4869 domain-containing protein [Eubacteriales bacterium]|nr:DUF4869 domain-containing protein [Eubacteriales bacterium]
MLYVLFGCIKSKDAPREYVAHIDDWFDTFFEEEWMTDGWAKRVIKELDKSDLLYPKIIESPFLGTISYEDISGGAKQLIMAKAVSGVVYNGNNFGDNCWPLLLELSRERDVMIDLFYHPIFNWVDDIPVTIINDGSVVRSFKEFRDAHFKADGYRDYDFEEIAWPVKINKTSLMID